MPPSLGAHLRQSREEQGLSVADVSRETRLPERVLERLEADELDALPRGSYVRVFVKAYARALGADPGAILEAHAAELPDAQQPNPHPAAVPERRERMSLAPLVIALLLVVTVAVAAALLAGGRASPPVEMSRTPVASPLTDRA